MTWTRQRKLLAAVATVCTVAFAWFSYEVMTVFYLETNPTVDSRAALRSLALGGAGMTAELDAMYDAGEFEPRDEWDVELDYGRVRQSRTVPVDCPSATGFSMATPTDAATCFTRTVSTESTMEASNLTTAGPAGTGH